MRKIRCFDTEFQQTIIKFNLNIQNIVYFHYQSLMLFIYLMFEDKVIYMKFSVAMLYLIEIYHFHCKSPWLQSVYPITTLLINFF